MAKSPRDRLKAASSKVTAADRPVEAPPAGTLRRRTSVLADATRGGGVRATERRSVDPAHCRMWHRHNRHYDRLTVDNCAGLIESIRSQGQRVPAIVRELSEPEGDVRFEVIAGARRHFAVSALRAEGVDRDFLIEPVRLGDAEAFVIADAENRDRQDISDFERAQDYASALNAFYDGNATAMARAIGLPERQVQRYVAMTKLPDIVTDRITDPRELTRDQVEKILPVIRRTKPAELERKLPSTPAPAKTVVAALLSAKPKAQRGEDLLDAGGRAIGSVQVTPRNVTVRLTRQKGQDVDALLDQFRALAAQIGGRSDE